MTTSKKVIVTNKGALTSKYGASNFSHIESAINSMIGADQARFIIDTVVYVDDATQMKSYNGTAVKNAADDKQNKDAIDAICTSIDPDYVAILGAQDIIPLQILNNPTGDSDHNVPSDLPYACTAAYSKSISSFLSPTRVVGRIPGVPSINDPKALLNAINTSVSMHGLEKKNYNSYFSVSASVWEGSSKQSITNIAGNATNLHLSPPDGPNWTDQQLIPRIHFVNCHGSSNNANWYGQKGNNYPIAVQASQIAKKIIPNTIGAAECCYGGQLYNPGGVCTSYLNSGIASFCGSTNIAYGPTNGQGEADLITQYFLINLLATSSAGSAMLQARQTYINGHKPMSIYDLKTIAQFNLLGDPSSHPVIPNESSDQKAMHEKAATRTLKRNELKLFGQHIQQTYSVADQVIESKGLDLVLDEANKHFSAIKSYKTYSENQGSLMKALNEKMNAPQVRLHIVEEEELHSSDQKHVSQRVLIAKEIEGEIVSYRFIHSK